MTLGRKTQFNILISNDLVKIIIIIIIRIVIKALQKKKLILSKRPTIFLIYFVFMKSVIDRIEYMTNSIMKIDTSMARST